MTEDGTLPMLDVGQPLLPFASVPTRHKILSDYKREAVCMEPGSVWYIVNRRWMDKFEALESCDPGADGAEDDSEYDSKVLNAVGAIDNGCLINSFDPLSAPSKDNPSHWTNCPKPDLGDDDYTAVSAAQWEVLHTAFGGGPPIPRAVVLAADRKQPIISLESIRVQVGHTANDVEDMDRVVVYAHLDTPISTFRAEAAKAINLQNPDDHTFWDYFSNTNHSILDRYAASTTLREANIQEDQPVVFAVKEADDETTNQPITSNCMALSTVLNDHSMRRSAPGMDTTYDCMGQMPGLTGLTNLGNTCFMNSSLQCLAHTVPLLKCFLSGSYISDINADNPLGKGGEVARAFGSLIQKVWQGNLASVAPREFKSVLGKHAAQFYGYDQHDSQELLSYLLDMLHEDINRIKQKPYIEERDDNDAEDEDLASESWSNYRARNDSSIVDHFQGLLKSTLDCPECGHHKRKFDPFIYLSLPLPGADLQTREFTVVTVDGSQLPIRCAATVKKHCLIADFCTCVCQVLGLAVENPLVVLSIATLSYHKLTVHEDPNGELPAVGRSNSDKVLVYHYPTPTTGPLGGGRKTIIWPPTSNYGTAPAAPLLLWVQPNTISIDTLQLPSSSSVSCLSPRSDTRLVVRNTCLLSDNVDDALRPFKRHKTQRLSANTSRTVSPTISSQVAPNPSTVHSEMDTLDTITPEIDASFVHVPTLPCEPTTHLQTGSDFTVIGVSDIEMGHPAVPTDVSDDGYTLINATTAESGMPFHSSNGDEMQTLGDDSGVAVSRPSSPVALPAWPLGQGSMGGIPAGSPLHIWQDETAIGVPLSNSKNASITGTTGSTDPESVFRIVVSNEYGSPTSSSQFSGSSPGSGDPQFFKMEIAQGTEPSALFDLEAMSQPLQHASCDLLGVCQQHTLEECVQSYLASEVLSRSDAWFCPKCRTDVQARKALELWRLPEVLVVHLKRFSVSVVGTYSTTSHKLDSLVTFPLHGLNLAKYTHCGHTEDTMYDCFAVSNHFGSASGGHYNAFCCQPNPSTPQEQAWYLFDDSSVSPASDEAVVTSAAYVLFYRRRSSALLDRSDLIDHCKAEFAARQAAEEAQAAAPMDSCSPTTSDVPGNADSALRVPCENDVQQPSVARVVSMDEGSVPDDSAACEAGVTGPFSQDGGGSGGQLVTSANSDASSHGPASEGDVNQGEWNRDYVRGRGSPTGHGKEIVSDWLHSSVAPEKATIESYDRDIVFESDASPSA